MDTMPNPVRKKEPNKAPKRTPDQIRRDRRRVAELMLQSLTQAQIADILREETGIVLSRKTISNDIQIIRKDWLENRRDSYEALVNEELARLDSTEGEVWRAWRASCSPLEKKQVEEIAKEVEGDIEMMVSRIVTITEGGNGVGDPRLMDKIIALQKERRRVLGLYAPAKLGIDISGKSELIVKGYALKDSSPDMWPDVVEGELTETTKALKDNNE